MLDAVTKHYQMGENTVRALRGASVTIDEGEFIAIMGPSGSGKSTLMNMIGALDTPTDGTVEIEGTDISTYTQDQLSELRREKIGFVFQQFNLIHSMTAKENVMMPMTFAGLKRPERKERASTILERVGLADRQDFEPSKLSGGQQQRVSIARSLANDPDIILADEPTGNLDTETGDTIMELLEELNDAGKTIVMVTHDPHDAEFAGRIVRIRDGQIERTDTDGDDT
jgi:putative ABC transport system ATP-binding protein